ncbi:hypothetical protein Tco_1133077 [Tanacetum coccineum]|uniref:Uncharacterized protein n=1 Tax=Tanacetum coccineum TaxID=301880 RepID=A0ABQ5JED0_9ASTR
MAEGEIDNLTMEQYLTLTRGNQAPGVVKPEIRGNVNFEIKSQFMPELREDTFFGNKKDDAHEHVERVLDIVGLFNIPGVTHDAIMLRVFPIIVKRAGELEALDLLVVELEPFPLLFRVGRAVELEHFTLCFCLRKNKNSSMSSPVSSSYHIRNAFDNPLLETISSTELEKLESNSSEFESNSFGVIVFRT